MSVLESPSLVAESSPYFSALWLGRHPSDSQPRVVACFGPSLPHDSGPARAVVLGLEPVVLGGAPPLTAVLGHVVVGERLVVRSADRELFRTEPMSGSLAAVLRWRAEVLLVWVDVPLGNPQTELAMIGLQHVWTGIAAVTDGSLPARNTITPRAAPHARGVPNRSRTAPVQRPAPL